MPDCLTIFSGEYDKSIITLIVLIVAMQSGVGIITVTLSKSKVSPVSRLTVQLVDTIVSLWQNESLVSLYPYIFILHSRFIL